MRDEPASRIQVGSSRFAGLAGMNVEYTTFMELCVELVIKVLWHGKQPIRFWESLVKPV